MSMLRQRSETAVCANSVADDDGHRNWNGPPSAVGKQVGSAGGAGAVSWHWVCPNCQRPPTDHTPPVKNRRLWEKSACSRDIGGTSPSLGAGPPSARGVAVAGISISISWAEFTAHTAVFITHSSSPAVPHPQFITHRTKGFHDDRSLRRTNQLRRLRTPRRVLVRKTWIDRVVVLSVCDAVDMLSAAQLTEAIRDALAKAPAGLIVDLTEVEFLASIGMSVLLAAQQEADAISARFAIVAEGAATSRPIKLLGLDDILALYPTLDDAMRDWHSLDESANAAGRI